MIEISTGKTFSLTFKAISQSLEILRKTIPAAQLEDLINVLQEIFYSEKKVIVFGIGRSLLVGKTFAMRLMHLGFNSYATGEVATPAVDVDDMFLVISKNLLDQRISVAMNMAKKVKARIVLITSLENGTLLLKKADHLLIIPDVSKKIRLSGAYTPLGTLFEISTMVLLDCIIGELMSHLGTTEEDMKIRHSNI